MIALHEQASQASANSVLLQYSCQGRIPHKDIAAAKQENLCTFATLYTHSRSLHTNLSLQLSQSDRARIDVDKHNDTIHIEAFDHKHNKNLSYQTNEQQCTKQLTGIVTKLDKFSDRIIASISHFIKRACQINRATSTATTNLTI